MDSYQFDTIKQKLDTITYLLNKALTEDEEEEDDEDDNPRERTTAKQ